MKKLWLTLFLSPVLIFSGYSVPEYDEEADFGYLSEEMDEEFDSSYSRRHHSPRASARGRESYAYEDDCEEEDDAVVYEHEEYEEESVAAEPKRASRGRSASSSMKDKRKTHSSQIAAPTSQRKHSPVVRKRSFTRKGPAVKTEKSSRSKIQESRQNPNRPKVTQRQKESPHLDQLEVDAKSDAVKAEKKDQTVKSYQARKTYRNSTPKAKSHHSGKRPVSD